MSADTFHARRVEESILRLDSMPQLPGTPPFPLAQLAAGIEQCFDIEGLVLEASEPQWLEKKKVSSSLGTPLVPIHMVAPPLDGSFSWLMADRDYRQILTWVLLKQDGPPPNVDQDLHEGFARFVGLEIMHLVEQVKFVDELVLRQCVQGDLAEGPFLCIDVTAAYHDQKVFGRLALSALFVESWRQRYNLGVKRHITPELAQEIEVPLSVRAGGTQLSSAEWDAVKPGDVLLADSCGIQPGTGQGKVTVALDGKSLFGGSLSNGSVTIENNL